MVHCIYDIKNTKVRHEFKKWKCLIHTVHAKFDYK